MTDGTKPGGEGLVKGAESKRENMKGPGVFNDAEWEFVEDNKPEGVESEQELTGGVTSKIKMFETVEEPKPQRVGKQQGKVVKKPESEGDKRNKKLVGDAFNSEGESKIAENKVKVKQQPGSNLGKTQSKLGGTQVAAEKPDKNLTEGGKGGNLLEAESEEKAKEETQVKEKPNQSSSLMETQPKVSGNEDATGQKMSNSMGRVGGDNDGEEGGMEEMQKRVRVRKQGVEKPKRTEKLATVEEEKADQLEDTDEAFAALLNDTGGDETENSGDKTKGISEATVGKPMNRSTPRKTGADQGKEITEQELKERGIPRKLGPTGLLREEAEERGGYMTKKVSFKV